MKNTTGPGHLQVMILIVIVVLLFIFGYIGIYIVIFTCNIPLHLFTIYFTMFHVDEILSVWPYRVGLPSIPTGCIDV